MAGMLPAMWVPVKWGGARSLSWGLWPDLRSMPLYSSANRSRSGARIHVTQTARGDGRADSSSRDKGYSAPFQAQRRATQNVSLWEGASSVGLGRVGRGGLRRLDRPAWLIGEQPISVEQRCQKKNEQGNQPSRRSVSPGSPCLTRADLPSCWLLAIALSSIKKMALRPSFGNSAHM